MFFALKFILSGVAGRPYFVMELVRGIPVTEYCDDRNLTTEERLRIFQQICTAVQHAHQKGIIHRDIKPSNILVATNGDQAVPMVIDFGIAKATQGPLTDKTLFTQFRQFIGTPAYMSPEQAQMSAVDVDTRSDIYSLGVLLYELLTGKTPLDSSVLVNAGYEEICRWIREEEAIVPSKRISSLQAEELKRFAMSRRIEPKSFQASIRGGLDWIAMKAVEKDRSRRYSSADAMARDVERYLNREPVTAVPPSTTYLLRKFFRRNQRVMTTAAVVSATLVIATLVSAWLAFTKTQLSSKLAHEILAKDQAIRQKSRLLYVSDMSMALRAWKLGNVDRVRDMLDRHRPLSGQIDRRHFEWYYLWHLCKKSRSISTLQTSNEVTWAAVSRDGRLLATAIEDSIILWDPHTRKELGRLDGHVEQVRCVVFSPDGTTIASAAEDVRLWNAKTGELLRMFKGHRESVWTVAFSRDGKMLVSGGRDKSIRLWDVKTGTERGVLSDHTETVSALAFSPDRTTFASCSHDQTAILWDLATLKKKHVLKEHSDWVGAIAFFARWEDFSLGRRRQGGHSVERRNRTNSEGAHWPYRTGTVHCIL